MKDNLQIKKFEIEKVHGVFNIVEESTFFCSKIMDIEDLVSITDKCIQYYQINSIGTTSYGYQYYDKNFLEELRKFIVEELNDRNLSLD